MSVLCHALQANGDRSGCTVSGIPFENGRLSSGMEIQVRPPTLACSFGVSLFCTWQEPALLLPLPGPVLLGICPSRASVLPALNQTLYQTLELPVLTSVLTLHWTCY